MNDEQIADAWEEVVGDDTWVDLPVANWIELKRFALVIANKEREECAKVCENWSHANGDDCAEAIRARGQE